ncbi:branched-chain amino acid ABC transporter periplasmic protein [Salinarchaeum sp. Harcht-Bsk1]|uniref:ABC transporter substrate-binding protein n=1 Tax=Salinarchaeum sp. Harcht-Bsk1 TaxID=1333523 RepID=UPI000342445A|nr:ABC transporter substrate-binding protein [Salinarchaeum sp. Harcht-Bsk1]AGN01311.1 branched-chain amino acid ABC transporter periplasmic protein [Salinarchaeum sp. Harcht-Bsk1]
MARRYDRRTILKGTAAGITITLAGCLGDDGGDDEDGDADGADGGDGDGNMTDGDGTDGDGDGDDTAVPGSEAGRTVSVGVLQPVTGDLGDLGGPIRDAAILPGAQLEGETDFEIDIRDEDTESTPEAGISAAESLANAGYPAVTGAASSAVTQNVAQSVFIPQGIVGCSPASTSPAITNLDDDDLIFRTAPSDALQGEVMAQVAYEDRDLQSAAVFHLNNEYGELLAESFASAFEEIGGSVQTQTAFEAEQPSYTSALDSTLSDDPDLLVVIGYPASGTQIFRDYYSDFDAERTVMVTDGLQSSDLPGNVDNPMENVLGTAPLASGPNVDAFNQLYEDEYGQAPGVFNAQAYDATAILLLANVAAGENDGIAIRDQMRAVANPEGMEVGPSNLAEGIATVAGGEAVNYQGASSPVTFDENGDVVAVTYSIWEFGEGGAIEQIETVDFGP